jgi:hypothetical protein
MQVLSYTTCLAHLGETDRAAYLAILTHGADIDHRGTPLSRDLLNQLLAALRDPSTARPRFGAANFDEAVFHGHVTFSRVEFAGDASSPAAGAEPKCISALYSPVSSDARGNGRVSVSGAETTGSTAGQKWEVS